MARIITVTSGKGGVGKTSISLNLALALADEGFTVCLFDADLGLANVSILTGLYPERDMASVIWGASTLKEIMIQDFMGIDIIPGSSGVEKMADLSQAQTSRLISAFLDFDDYDYFIFDTSAGISAQVLSFCMASHEIILVATCEPTSLTDAYSMLKAISKHHYNNPVRVIINQVTSGKAAKKAYQSLKQTTHRFLSIPLQPLGIMAADKNVKAAVISQTPFFKLFPDTVATKCIQAIKQRLLKQQISGIPMELFWDKALKFLEASRQKEKEKQPKVSGQTISQPHTEDVSNLKDHILTLESKITHLADDIAVIKQILMSKNDQDRVIDDAFMTGKKKTALPQATIDEKDEIKDRVSRGPVPLDFESWYSSRKTD